MQRPRRARVRPLALLVAALLLLTPLAPALTPVEDLYATQSGGAGHPTESEPVEGAPDQRYAILEAPGRSHVWASGFAQPPRAFERVLIVARLHVDAPMERDQLVFSYSLPSGTGATEHAFRATNVEDADVLLDVTQDRAWTAADVADLTLRMDYEKSGGGKRGEGRQAFVDAMWVRVEEAHHLEANFSWSPDAPRTNETIQFQDLSSSSHGIASWSWDFGDGNASSLSTPMHAYERGGTYLVTLHVQDAVGATAQAIQEVHVEPEAHHLVADFTWSPASPSAGQSVQFQDLSNASHAITSWSWDFGDGNASQLSAPAHAYERTGAYLVTLRVQDATGATAHVTRALQVENDAPRAAFTFSPSHPTRLDNVSFADLSSDPDGRIVAWSWDFGDGNASSDQHPSRRYEHLGITIVRLTVTDDQGAQATHERQVHVRNLAPSAAFSWTAGAPGEGLRVQFHDLSADADGDVANWTWDFGDGNLSHEASPLHEYAQDGQYLVRLVVTDGDGAQQTFESTLTLCQLLCLDVQMARAQFGMLDRVYGSVRASAPETPVTVTVFRSGMDGTMLEQRHELVTDADGVAHFEVERDVAHAPAPGSIASLRHEYVVQAVVETDAGVVEAETSYRVGLIRA